MLQLIVWIACVYLALKGKEIELLAASASHGDRDHNLRHARTWTSIAYVAALIFFGLSFAISSSLPSSAAL